MKPTLWLVEDNHYMVMITPFASSDVYAFCFCFKIIDILEIRGLIIYIPWTKFWNVIIHLQYKLCTKCSSLLEIECLNWESKGKSKDERKTNDHSSSYAFESISIPKVTPNKLLHCLSSLHTVFYITKLCNNQAIQGPRDRTYPEEPSPPYRHPLLHIYFNIL